MSTLADRVRNIFNKDKPESTETTTTNTATTTTTDTQPPAASMEIQSQHAVAKFGGTVIAETDNYEVVDGNIYFPPDSLKQEYFRETETHTTCPWKGLASYYTIDVDGTVEEDAAWFYPDTKEKAQHIKGYVAFYKNKVDITST